MFRDISLAVHSAWDEVKLTLKVGFICPFVVIDPTDLGVTTELLFQALCLSIFNLSQTENSCLFTDGNKACLFVFIMVHCYNNNR